MPSATVAAYRRRAGQSLPEKTAAAHSAAISTMNANGLNSNRTPSTNEPRTIQPHRCVCSPRTIAYNVVKNSGSDGPQVEKCCTSIVGDRKFVGQST